MKITVAVSKRDSNAEIPDRLRDAKFLFLIELDGMQVEKIFAAEDGDIEILFAKATVEGGAESIICGVIESEVAFSILTDEQITRLDGTGLTANGAVRAMIDYRLPYIMDVAGGVGCRGGEIAEGIGMDVLGRRKEAGE